MPILILPVKVDMKKQEGDAGSSLAFIIDSVKHINCSCHFKQGKSLHFQYLPSRNGRRLSSARAGIYMLKLVTLPAFLFRGKMKSCLQQERAVLHTNFLSNKIQPQLEGNYTEVFSTKIAKSLGWDPLAVTSQMSPTNSFLYLMRSSMDNEQLHVSESCSVAYPPIVFSF